MFVKANQPTSIELRSTREDGDEQARAAVAYPEVASLPEGLAETLAGAPELLRTHHRSRGHRRPPKAMRSRGS